MKGLELHWGSYNYELEDKITKEVQSTLKYFNIHNSIVDFYTITDI
jgi:hypothetical protein